MLVSSVPLSLTHCGRLTAHGDEGLELASDPHARQRGVGHQRQALAGTIIDHGQDAEAAAAGQLIRHKVERPAVVRRHRNQHRRPGPDRPLATATAAHRKLLFPVEPEQLLVVDHVTFTLERTCRRR